MKEYTLIINGMHGEHCVNLIRKTLANQTAVTTQTVEQGRAYIIIDEDQTSKEQIIAAIEKLGYKVVR